MSPHVRKLRSIFVKVTPMPEPDAEATASAKTLESKKRKLRQNMLQLNQKIRNRKLLQRWGFLSQPRQDAIQNQHPPSQRLMPRIRTKLPQNLQHFLARHGHCKSKICYICIHPFRIAMKTCREPHRMAGSSSQCCQSKTD